MLAEDGAGSPVIELDVDGSFEDRVDRRFLHSVLGEALAGRTSGGPVSVGLTIMDDEGIRKMNAEYRGVDAPTDVISFPMLEYEAPERPRPGFPSPPGEPVHLGDVVISFERAVEQASEFGHSLDREIAFLAVHGAMHLLGYDHEVAEDEIQMRQVEEAVLSRLGLDRGS